MSRVVVLKRRQSLYDVALIFCGDASVASEISLLNGISVTDDVVAGTELFVPEIKDSKIVDKYRLNDIEPATGEVGDLSPGGIGYMAVGVNFIVS